MSEAEKPEPSAGYGFTFGVPGKYYKGVREQSAAGARVKAWAPLFNFPWPGPSGVISGGTSLVPGNGYTDYDSETFKRFLSVEELEECGDIGHWLLVEQSLRDSVSVRVRMNSFLMALWLAKPTRTYIAFRLEEIEGGGRAAARLLDRFQWIEGHVADALDARDLERVRFTFPILVEIYSTSRRLRNALVLTFRGCVSNDWQSSFICFAAATEALLAHSQGSGIVGRLADAYSRMTATSDGERKLQRDYFKNLYAVRSKIMHGRAHDRKSGETNLKDLAAMSGVVRELWDRILDSEELRHALD